MSIEPILSKIRRYEARRLRWWVVVVVAFWFAAWLYSWLSLPTPASYDWTETEAEALLSLFYPVAL